MKYLSNAKINLNLIVTGLEDGFHQLYSIVAPIELFDEIEISLNNEGQDSLKCDKEYIPLDKNNIILKCIEKLREFTYFKQGVDVVLKKSIPTEAGLGGGSSNGAIVLKALNEILNLNLSNEQLIEIANKVGSDIPLFIVNKLALIEGKGEKITILKDNKFNPYILLVKPEKGVSTKEAFSLLDKMMKTKDYHPLILHELIEKNNLNNLNEFIRNDLLRPAISLLPEIETILDEIAKTKTIAFSMSGSGSCCFGLYKDYKDALEAYELLKNKYNFVFLTKIIK